MKAIILSVRPQWVAKILNGKKTIEIRKNVPKDFKGWVYIYCTNSNPYLTKIYDEWYLTKYGCEKSPNGKVQTMSGKVVARFWLDEYTLIYHGEYSEPRGYGNHNEERVYTISYGNTYFINVGDLEKSCLNREQLLDYGVGKPLYAWHIKRLEIFNTPKKLNEFERRYAPQSWCYVEVKEVIENE